MTSYLPWLSSVDPSLFGLGGQAGGAGQCGAGPGGRGGVYWVSCPKTTERESWGPKPKKTERERERENKRKTHLSVRCSVPSLAECNRHMSVLMTLVCLCRT